MTLKGLDVSGWQPNIDLSKVPGDFVIVKATGGSSFVSDVCDKQYQQAKSLGKLKGVYHFAREKGHEGTAESEADHFIATTKGYQDGKTMLVLDWEGDNTSDVGWALRWLQRVERATGIKPLIYMSAAVANANDWTTVAKAGYGVWIAAYVLGYQVINGYDVPSGLAPVPYWDTLAMWQFTSSGRLPGWSDNLDLNVFYGDSAAWLRYCAKSGTVTPDGGDITPITGGLFMSLTPAQEQEILTAAGRTNRYVDAPIGAVPGKILDVDITRADIGGDTSLRSTIAHLDANLAAIKSIVDQLAAAKGVTIDYARIKSDVTSALAAGIKVTGTISGAAS